jgi:hypothetical protein
LDFSTKACGSCVLAQGRSEEEIDQGEKKKIEKVEFLRCMHFLSFF